MVFKCKMCAAPLEINQGETIAFCESCGTQQTLPKFDNEKKINLFDRANHFRRNNEYDKAMSIYEKILEEDNSDAETYWSLVLCRYGIEYVEDPATKKRVPTVNRAQLTSVLADEDYKSALKYADHSQKQIYQAEARAIEEIQKGILAISQKEEPFDIFICYKETDPQGGRTRDSVLAHEMYYQLVDEGFKVFFARITLEDKLGTQYEPYIFAALNSAKVMIVIGTKPEYFNAPWVKNEWSRYLNIIKNDPKKMLIPAYMDAYDMPDELSHLQGQDMTKLGFMQDLIRGIKKIVDEPVVATRHSAADKAEVISNPLLERAAMAIEDGEFNKAHEFCEQILNQNPKNAEAYLYKMMVDYNIKNLSDLVNGEITSMVFSPLEQNKNFQKALRFADDAMAGTLRDLSNAMKEKEKEKEERYNKAVCYYESDDVAQIEEAVQIFSSLKGFNRRMQYKNSNEMVENCKKKIAEIHQREKEEKERIRRLHEDLYSAASKDYETHDIEKIKRAADIFTELAELCDYRDSRENAALCKEKIEWIIRKEEEEKKNAARSKLIQTIANILAIITGLIVVFGIWRSVR